MILAIYSGIVVAAFAVVLLAVPALAGTLWIPACVLLVVPGIARRTNGRRRV